ncbi:MAG TPA: chemotaxis protein CheX [Thermotogota bacterium]|nr:chemotaxis protein CheX [Thermotogota bacterium]HRW92117.1 chemotaxis protein CheX [Thermotogota bacterium]
MDVRLINAILRSVVKVFSEAVNLTLELEKPQLGRDLPKGYDLVTIVGFNGSLSGNLVYGMDVPLALEIVGQMMGMPYEQLDDLSMSAIGELSNMISGNVAMNLEQLGKPIDITPPSVVVGKEIQINVDGVILKIPGKVAGHPMQVNMVFRE